MDFKKINSELNPYIVLKQIGYDNNIPKELGNEMRGRCPIHKGDNPLSLCINKSKNIFTCFSCGEKGDLIELYSKAMSISQVEAAKQLTEESSLLCATKTTMQYNSEKTYTEQDVIRCWNNAKESGEDTYFKYKKLDPPKGMVKFGANPKGHTSTLLLLTDINKSFRGFTCLTKNNKYNYIVDGATTRFTMLGNIDEHQMVFVGEGIATVQTVWEAYEKNVIAIAAGSSNNVLPAIETIKKHYPNKKIIALIDTDKAGQKVAEKIKQSFADVGLVTPGFKQ